jgi:hypothetical protein
MNYRIFVVLSVFAVAGCSSGSASSTTAPTSAPDAASAEAEELDVDEGTFTVPAGQEVVYCVRIPMPASFQGRDLAMTSWESDVSVPAHHYFMFYDPSPTSGTQPVPCEGTNPLVQASTAGLNLFSMGALLFVAGTGHDAYAADPGYGTVLTKNGSFVTNHHVINAGAEPVTVSAHFKLMVKNATAVMHPVQALSCQTIDISLPAETTTDVTATCLAPYDLDLVTMSSHAHQDLMTFEQRFYDGQQTQPAVLYSSAQWDSPLVQHLSTPLHLKAGQGVTFTCHFDNKTGSEIGFGLTATTEMCAAMNEYAYPADHAYQVPPMLGTTITSNATPATANDTAKGAIPLF